MSGTVAVRSAADPGVRLLVEGGDAVLEGVIVDGVREEDGQWDLDSRFVLLTDDGERIRVNGWMCLIEVDEELERDGKGKQQQGKGWNEGDGCRTAPARATGGSSPCSPGQAARLRVAPVPLPSGRAVARAGAVRPRVGVFGKKTKDGEPPIWIRQ